MNNTGNAVGSTSPLDLQDNAITLDQLINSDAIEVTSRTGKKLKGIAALQSIIASLDLGSFTFSDTASGLAGTTDGQYFRVTTNSSGGFYYYKNLNGSAVQVASLSGEDKVNELVKALAKIGSESSGITNGIYPIHIDADNNVVLGYDSENDTLVGSFYDSLHRANDGQSIFNGSGNVFPFYIDADNNVILGYDSENDTLVGSGLRAFQQYSHYIDEKFPFNIIVKAINQTFSWGQSLAVGTQGSPAITNYQNFGNLMFKDGVFGTDNSSLVSAIEQSRETGWVTQCNMVSLHSLQKTGKGFVSLVSAPGAGGYRITQLNKGTDRYQNYLLPKIKGGVALNADLQIDTVCWIQGEADSGDGAYHVETLEGYKALLKSLVDDINTDAKAATGQEHPVIFLTYQHSTYTAEGNTQQAMLELAEEDDRVYVIVPTYIFPHFTDNLHLTNIGYRWMGAYFGRARSQILIDKIKPRGIKPLACWFVGNDIFIKLTVPSPPLVFNINDFSETKNYGFSVKSGDSLLDISDINIIDGDTVKISLPISVTGDMQVRYAYDYNAVNLKKGGTGNLVDSCTDTISIQGSYKPMPYVCPHFKINPFNGAV